MIDSLALRETQHPMMETWDMKLVKKKRDCLDKLISYSFFFIQDNIKGISLSIMVAEHI
jgi:hypothetical protein